MKKFSSFKEIDRELEILSIERQLQTIKLSQSASRAFNSITPGNLLAEAIGPLTAYLPKSGIVQKFIIMLIAKKILK